MQIVIEVSDTKASFVLELLKSLPFVDVKSENKPQAPASSTPMEKKLSPKTASLLGAFPMLATIDEESSRQQAVRKKHLK
ncbi:hypothetical protein DYU11_13060 [Fibrisoma montanum]|uniref:Uncharacterized protein n=1 Tax=Fibrisoma montanum TaxID=2305895 RepID=A0A418MBZ1_9BACT|nr:hypothetical protein [Fibrisoma montanum]RIV23888.1 hypothetical protein DYU11_13060 [Fibrisoma montanum]